MNIIIPMSGTGNRFIKAGYKDIKPLIKVDGKPIIEHVVNMFGDDDNYIFICNKVHLKDTDLKNVLLRFRPNSKLIGIDSHKYGPVYAVLNADYEINGDEPVIVSYCDFSLYWDYNDFKKKVAGNDCDGCVISYKGFHPHLLYDGFYAGISADKDNNMLEIREKYSFTENKMDSYQSAGSYYFKKVSYIKKYFQSLIDKNININNEYYVSMIYQLMKEDNLDIYIFDVAHFLQWGTPQDLEEYVYWSEYFHKKYNMEYNND